jgi:putative acyl-CoA dehydrogenase
VLRMELDGANNTRLKAFAGRLVERLAAPERNDESQARALTRDLVLALQAALLIKHAPASVADAFCAARLGGDSGAFGLMPRGTDLRAILERAGPV